MPMEKSFSRLQCEVNLFSITDSRLKQGLLNVKDFTKEITLAKVDTWANWNKPKYTKLKSESTAGIVEFIFYHTTEVNMDNRFCTISN